MVKYIIKRILYSILILFFVSVLIYFLVRCLPTDYIDNKFADKLGQGQITQEQIDDIKRMYGLLDNSFFGILSGYFTWLSNVLKLDLGTSFKFELPVAEVIGEYMWISFGISLVAMVLQFLIAIPLGVMSATHQYGPMDYVVTIFTMIGISLPSFFLATLLIKVFSTTLGWLPMQGLTDAMKDYTGLAKVGDIIRHCILPVATLVIINIGGLMRYSRTNTLEVLNADYIRTARAKGLSEHTVIYKHVFRNTMIPLVTMMAGILPGLFGGAMITEEVFALQGIGQKAYQALKEGDVPFIMGYNMFLAILTVIGTLLADLAYAVVDPRVKLDK
ncbi:MAG TPA: ABC transporter permease [Candidatus Scatosoma pullistercoris]|uniref:ABC transporter permease n=1 Tax=Candidatus Scatosoma pullistercoris TaxID=2840934 RepID=A0A9D1MDZ8_9FIRM|nr:ABC transporter permease [Candidatus Scatosoma pullistercoris]